jgi:hypothetical protein
MEAYDTVIVPCAHCSSGQEQKSRSGPCDDDYWDLDEAPDDVVVGLTDANITCEECGSIFKINKDEKVTDLLKGPDEKEEKGEKDDNEESDDSAESGEKADTEDAVKKAKGENKPGSLTNKTTGFGFVGGPDEISEMKGVVNVGFFNKWNSSIWFFLATDKEVKLYLKAPGDKSWRRPFAYNGMRPDVWKKLHNSINCETFNSHYLGLNLSPSERRWFTGCVLETAEILARKYAKGGK